MSKLITGVSPFPALCVQFGLPRPEPEVQFDPVRKWRFDWGWRLAVDGPNGLVGVALEIEGGAFTRSGPGRHSRGAGFRADLEKYQAAAQAGWLVVRCLPEQFDSGGVFPVLVAVFSRFGPQKNFG